MAKEELNSDSKSILDAMSIAETKSAVLMSALFVLRKLVFNQKRYRLDEQINHSENLSKFVKEFKNTYRLYEWSVFGEESENTQLEQYLFKVQLHELLYKIHHTILSLMPPKVENYIEHIDYLLKEFSSESIITMVTVRDRVTNLISWFDELVENDFPRT